MARSKRGRLLQSLLLSETAEYRAASNRPSLHENWKACELTEGAIRTHLRAVIRSAWLRVARHWWLVDTAHAPVYFPVMLITIRPRAYRSHMTDNASVSHAWGAPRARQTHLLDSDRVNFRLCEHLSPARPIFCRFCCTRAQRMRFPVFRRSKVGHHRMEIEWKSNGKVDR